MRGPIPVGPLNKGHVKDMTPGSLKFSVLASGSRGNACYVETNQVRVLVDAGLSCREMIRRLELIGARPKELDALILTHEHTDHIRGVGAFSRRFDLPVYTNSRTFERGRKALGRVDRTVVTRTGESITIKNLCAETFTKCHDAVDPFGLILSFNGVKIGMATDLGRSTALVQDRLGDCNALILEFNYDHEMLEQGPYPLELKRRIRGGDGHLSNEQAGDLLRLISHEKLDLVVLAHLSEINNRPEKALEAASKALHCGGRINTNIVVSVQGEPTSLIEVPV